MAGPSLWPRSAGNVGALCSSGGSSGGGGGGCGGGSCDSESASAAWCVLEWHTCCCWPCWRSMDARSWDSIDSTPVLDSGIRCCCANRSARGGPSGSGGNTTRCCCCCCWNWVTTLDVSMEKGLSTEVALLGAGAVLGSSAIATAVFGDLALPLFSVCLCLLCQEREDCNWKCSAQGRVNEERENKETGKQQQPRQHKQHKKREKKRQMCTNSLK